MYFYVSIHEKYEVATNGLFLKAVVPSLQGKEQNTLPVNTALYTFVTLLQQIQEVMYSVWV